MINDDTPGQDMVSSRCFVATFRYGHVVRHFGFTLYSNGILLPGDGEIMALACLSCYVSHLRASARCFNGNAVGCLGRFAARLRVAMSSTLSIAFLSLMLIESAYPTRTDV